MAIFIPNIPETFNGSLGEENVFMALRVLDDNYTVFHSLSWIGINDRTVGEADFVIMHPGKGIMVVEVKSGEIEYKDGNWYQINRMSNFKKKISPFSQAMRSQYEILDRLSLKFSNWMIPLVCHSVWFPSITINRNDALPPEASHQITFDEKSLLTPADVIDGSFLFWSRKTGISKLLTTEQFQKVINELCPYLHIVPKMSNVVDEAERQYIKLTNQQISILNVLEEQRTAVIQGIAGTGKTVLAVEKAKMLSAAGENVLFLCYNSFLRDWLRKTNNIPNVVFHNVHSLSYEFVGDPTIPVDEIIDYFEVCIQDEENQSKWAYTNIIIDEGQDISDSVLCSLSKTAKRNKGCFYVFFDKNQYVMHDQMPSWIENAECRLVLNRNCRNTMEIFRTACSIVGIDGISKANDIHGTVPNGRIYSTEKELLAVANNFVKHVIDGGLKPEDIVILTAQTVEKSWLHMNEKLYGYQLSDVICDGKILFSTIRKFKGLEAKAIMIVDLSIRNLADDGSKRLAYVGSSRAKHVLCLAIQEDIRPDEYGVFLKKINNERNVAKNRKGLGRLFNIEVNL